MYTERCYADILQGIGFHGEINTVDAIHALIIHILPALVYDDAFCLAAYALPQHVIYRSIHSGHCGRSGFAGLILADGIDAGAARTCVLGSSSSSLSSIF